MERRAAHARQSQLAKPVTPTKVSRRVRLESIVLDENKASVLFFLCGAGAGLAVLPGWHWPHHSLVVVLILIGVTLLAACARFLVGDRMPTWGQHASLVLGTLVISVVSAIGPSVHANFSVLFIWIAVYAALYFEFTAGAIHIGFAGVAYIVVLVAGHSSLRGLFVAWTSIFGTAVVLSAVAFVLVSLLRRTSLEDPLTSLANRRAWDERLEEELERARRNKTALSLAVIDIDNFKAVNDREGHATGDRLLCRFADGWTGVIRGSGDFVARLGGDEFGLLAPGSDEVGMQLVIDRLREIAPNGVSCSIGEATWDRVETAADLFRRADEAMYRAKRNWRWT